MKVLEMKVTSYYILFFGLLSTAKSLTPKLIVVSFDGFRHDYLKRNLTPVLNNLKHLGTYSEFLINVFPTQTFPNHFTLATGLYTETHGVLASHIYDFKNKKVLGYGHEMFHYLEELMPIWSVNEIQKPEYRSGVMMWPGGEFTYNNVNVTFNMPFDSRVKWEDRVDTAINWIKNPKTPANLVFIYFEEPDMESHLFGPNSKETNAQIMRVDKITDYILRSLKNNNLENVNVIFISDHGMEQIPKENIINLTTSVGDICDMYGSSPVLQVYPKPGVSEDTLYTKLQNMASTSKFRVYKKKNIPDYLHYANCRRTPPIIVLANPTYAFQDLYKTIEQQKKAFNISGNGPFGVHGYDPKDLNMQPFFLAKGPAFKQNYIPKNKIESVDLYPLISKILNLDPPVIKPNGSLSNIADILKQPMSLIEVMQVITISASASFVITLPILILYLRYFGKKHSSLLNENKVRSLLACEELNEIQEHLLGGSRPG